jgi:hypothetical protein
MKFKNVNNHPIIKHKISPRKRTAIAAMNRYIAQLLKENINSKNFSTVAKEEMHTKN